MCEEEWEMKGENEKKWVNLVIWSLSLCLKKRDGEYEGEKEGFGKVARLRGFGKELEIVKCGCVGCWASNLVNPIFTSLA